MTKITLNFSGSQIEGLYHDEILKLNLGTVKKKRWSNVEWNESKQRWEARRIEDGILIATHKSRDACIEAERNCYNQLNTNLE